VSSISFSLPSLLFFPSQKRAQEGQKKMPVGGGVKGEKINVTLDYGVLRGGVKIKGGVKLSILYGKQSLRFRGTIYFFFGITVFLYQNKNPVAHLVLGRQFCASLNHVPL